MHRDFNAVIAMRWTESVHDRKLDHNMIRRNCGTLTQIECQSAYCLSVYDSSVILVIESNGMFPSAKTLQMWQRKTIICYRTEGTSDEFQISLQMFLERESEKNHPYHKAYSSCAHESCVSIFVVVCSQSKF